MAVFAVGLATGVSELGIGIALTVAVTSFVLGTAGAALDYGPCFKDKKAAGCGGFALGAMGAGFGIGSIGATVVGSAGLADGLGLGGALFGGGGTLLDSIDLGGHVSEEGGANC